MILRNRLRIKLPCTILICILSGAISVPAQYRESPENGRPRQRRQQEEIYKEGKLRRFEIVTLIALPFTAIHSFLVVRGVEMIKQNEFAPELSGTNFKIIGASAASTALFIGFWDWLHTHDTDSSQQLIPATPSKPSAPQPRRKVGTADLEVEHAAGLVLPFVHVRF